MPPDGPRFSLPLLFTPRRPLPGPPRPRGSAVLLPAGWQLRDSWTYGDNFAAALTSSPAGRVLALLSVYAPGTARAADGGGLTQLPHWGAEYVAMGDFNADLEPPSRRQGG